MSDPVSCLCYLAFERKTGRALPLQSSTGDTPGPLRIAQALRNVNTADSYAFTQVGDKGRDDAECSDVYQSST